MRKLKSILLSIIVVFTIACKKESFDYTVLSGKIENTKSTELKIFKEGQSKGVIKIANDGTFVDTLNMEGEIYLVLGNVSTIIYALNGADLTINADANNFPNSVVITGQKSGMSNYIVAKSKINLEDRNNAQQLYSLEEAEFMLAAKQKMTDMLSQLEEVNDAPYSLIELEKKSLKASYTYSLINYPNYHMYYTQNKNYKPSEEMQSAMADFTENDGELYAYSNAYKSVIKGNNYQKGLDILNAREVNSLEMGKILHAKGFEVENIREDLLFDAVKSSLALAHNKEELYTEYMEVAKDEKNRAKLTEIYEQASKLDKGNPSPKFVDYENYSGETSSLDDFKGKYVYIDVWATWCRPCKNEIPHLQKMEKKYHGKNIVFVSISVDNENKKESWKKMIAEEQMGGVQLFASNTKFMKDYAIRGIPRFILIDPEGNIVNKNAPRPSDPKLVEAFTELGI